MEKKAAKDKEYLPTPRQKRAWEIIIKNPDMPTYEALILAGYERKSALSNGKRILNGRGFRSLADVYRYELVRNIKPRTLAKQLAKGVKSDDLRIALPYIQQATKDIGLADETPDTLIQINLSDKLKEYAT